VFLPHNTCEVFSEFTGANHLMEINFQKSFAERCFSLIDEYAPGFSSSVVGYDMLTPPDLEREFGLTGKLFPALLFLL
jgi:hypothetical protein